MGNTDLLVACPGSRPPLTSRPSIPHTGVAILSCMDARLNLFAIRGFVYELGGSLREMRL